MAGTSNNRLPELHMLRKHREYNTLMSNYIKNLASDGQPIDILDAGCGNHWTLNLGDVRYALTGVDGDQQALELRKTEVGDLDVAIHANLENVVLKEHAYDVIYCSFVLEHVKDATHVVEKLASSLKSGGLLILRFPDRDSVFGFVTRVTPFWLHVAFKKYIQGQPNAGKPGYDPFPVYYDKIISRKGIREFCSHFNLTIVAEYGLSWTWGGSSLRIKPILSFLFKQTIHLISLKKLAADHGGLAYVLQKTDQTEYAQVRHPPQSGWLDKPGRLKGGGSQ